jgi:hypothetical protein
MKRRTEKTAPEDFAQLHQRIKLERGLVVSKKGNGIPIL